MAKPLADELWQALACDRKLSSALSMAEHAGYHVERPALGLLNSQSDLVVFGPDTRVDSIHMAGISYEPNGAQINRGGGRALSYGELLLRLEHALQSGHYQESFGFAELRAYAMRHLASEYGKAFRAAGRAAAGSQQEQRSADVSPRYRVYLPRTVLVVGSNGRTSAPRVRGYPPPTKY